MADTTAGHDGAPGANGAAARSGARFGDMIFQITAPHGATEEQGAAFGRGLGPAIHAELASFFDGLSLEGDPATT